MLTSHLYTAVLSYR
uniref:Uncharacterized protein n=1 Tax=Lepeophtheirus salmonis TaxID=72036 RepID=A0A0K2V393_LEPSM